MTWRVVRAAAAVAAAAWWSVPAPAAAQSEPGARPRPPVALGLPAACAAVDLPALRRYLAVELQDLLLEPGAGRPDAVRLSLACQDARVDLTVADPLAPSAPLVRALALPASTARTRARLVALAAVELLFAAWVRPATPPTTPALPAPRPATAARHDAPPAPPRRGPPASPPRARAVALAPPRAWGVRVLAVGAVRVLGPSALAAFGGGARVVADATDVLAVQFDALGEGGRDAAGAPFTVWGGAAALAVHGQWSALRVRVGAGARGGAIVAAGGATVVPWAGPALLVVVGVHLARWVALELSVAQGFAFALRGAHPTLGGWGEAQFGLGFVP